MTLQHTGEVADVTVTSLSPDSEKGMVNIEIPIMCEAFLSMDKDNSRVVYGFWPDEARELARLLTEAAEKVG